MRYRALLFANANFSTESGLPPLRGPVRDVEALRDALIDSKRGLHETGDVSVFVDATTERIVEEVTRLLQRADPDDRLLIYYSGHGRRDVHGNLYLCGSNTRTQDEAALAASGLAASRVDEQIQRMTQAKSVILLLDCCHSGAFKDDGRTIPEALTGSGYHILMSSLSSQLAADAAYDTQSPFTKYVCTGLLRGFRREGTSDLISVDDLYHYVSPRLRTATGQVPLRRMEGSVGNVYLGRRIDQPPLSATEIRIDGATKGARIVETIDVNHRGPWNATCSQPWVEIEPHRTRSFFHVRAVIRELPARASIHVSTNDGSSLGEIAIVVSAAASSTSKESVPPPHLLPSTGTRHGVLAVTGGVAVALLAAFFIARSNPEHTHDGPAASSATIAPSPSEAPLNANRDVHVDAEPVATIAGTAPRCGDGSDAGEALCPRTSKAPTRKDRPPVVAPSPAAAASLAPALAPAVSVSSYIEANRALPLASSTSAPTQSSPRLAVPMWPDGGENYKP